MRQSPHSFKLIAVAAVAAAIAGLLAPMSAATAWAQTSERNVAVTVANNLDQPGLAPRWGSSVVTVSCPNGSDSKVKLNRTKTITCSVAEGEDLSLSYTAASTTGTVVIDCQSSASVSFSGGGTSAVYTQSCTDPAEDAGADPT